MTPGASVFEAGFVFLRHGQSTANLGGLIAGMSDVPLTERGREEAESAARKLRGAGIRRIVTSRLARAVQTARIVADALGLGVDQVEGLGERGWGVLEGRPLSERSDYFAAVDGAESWETFRSRIDAALDSLSGTGLLLVGHAGTWRVICTRIGLVTDAEPVRNATPIRIAARGTQPSWSILE